MKSIINIIHGIKKFAKRNFSYVFYHMKAILFENLSIFQIQKEGCSIDRVMCHTIKK